MSLKSQEIKRRLHGRPKNSARQAEQVPLRAGGRVEDSTKSKRVGRIGRPKGTGTQKVYAQLREDIIGLRLQPGADLDEATLERRFGVSRTPVREALIRLASEGLITLSPNRGAQITPIDISEVPQLFEAMDLCQRATLRWAALRRTSQDIEDMQRLNADFTRAAERGEIERLGDINREFHMIVALACGNAYFRDFYASLLTVSQRLARMCFVYAPKSGEPAEKYYGEIVRQHAAMIEAIEKRDVETADKLAREHTELFRDRIARYINAQARQDMSLAHVN